MNFKKEIKRISKLCVQDILLDPDALQLLKSFLQERSNGDKSLIQIYIELFEKCKVYLNQSGAISREQFEELCDLGLPFDIEYGKFDIISKGDGNCLKLIMEELVKKIELQKEIDDFHKELLRDIN